MALATTPTVVTNAQAVTTGGVSNLTKTSANAATSCYLLSVLVAVGAQSIDPSQRLRIWYTSSPYDISTTANVAQIQLKGTARYHDFQWGDRQPGATLIEDTSIENLTGGYIYAWLDGTTFGTAITVTITLVELT